MAALSLFRKNKMGAKTLFGKTIWSSTNRGFSKNKGNSIERDNRMEF